LEKILAATLLSSVLDLDPVDPQIICLLDPYPDLEIGITEHGSRSVRNIQILSILSKISEISEK
jgi:hypothetical protein